MPFSPSGSPVHRNNELHKHDFLKSYFVPNIIKKKIHNFFSRKIQLDSGLFLQK